MKTEKASQSGTARRYGLLLVIWSVLVCGSLLWNMHQETRNTLGAASAAARANIDKDLTFRKWATSHGGVYVPPTEHTPPNPYLKLPDRDVVTSTGKELTLMNPAYMLREMQTDFSDDYGTKSHITSLKLLNPKNAPDAWETEALLAFERGEQERLEAQQIDGRDYLRMILPLVAESGCLKCHGFQGYKVGEIRGGVSTAVSLAPYLARERELKITLALTHGAIWLIGLAGLGVSYRRDRYQASEGEKTEDELRAASRYTRSLIEASLDPLVTISAEGKITDVNQATETVTGRNRAELIGTDFSDYFTEPVKAREGYQQVFLKGSVTDYPLALRHRDGHVTDVLYNASIYRDEAGEMLGVFAAARDVTERNKAEQEVAQLSLQNKLILDSAGEGIYGLGTDGRCTFVNPTAVQLLGFGAEELVGQHAHDMFHHTRPDGRPYPEEECPVQVAYKQGEIHRGDDLYWRKDGSSFQVEFISTPMLEGGKITGAVVTFRDITERKLAEAQLRRSEHSLAEAQRIAHLGNWELDLVNNVLTWSDEIFRIFEIDPERFGASYEAFLNGIHPDDRGMVNKAYTDSVSSRVPYNIVHRLKMPDGRIKYVNEMCETYYSKDGKPLRSVGTVHDITERKLAEDEVRALNRELEQRVIMRTAELEAANKELEAFSYSVSHDLRTPLRAIDGFSRILLEEYTNKLDDEGKRLLNVVRDNTNRMGQLIEDILKFSRTGRVEITPAEIDMEKMAHAVFEELQPAVAGGKVQLEIEHLPHARGDSAMMHQVFVNLLSNAIKFSSFRDPAQIRVGGAVRGDEAVYFVQDNGAGFDMQYADKLFGVFQRLHGVTEFEGTGIGLAIVKRIVNRHGGRVWAEGKLNEGATIYFALPTKEKAHG
jgi:PAS domain S-box-containing protein